MPRSKPNEEVLDRVERVIPASPTSTMTSRDIAEAVGVPLRYAQDALAMLTSAGRIAYHQSAFRSARYYFRTDRDGKIA